MITIINIYDLQPCGYHWRLWHDINETARGGLITGHSRTSWIRRWSLTTTYKQHDRTNSMAITNTVACGNGNTWGSSNRSMIRRCKVVDGTDRRLWYTQCSVRSRATAKKRDDYGRQTMRTRASRAGPELN